MLSAPAGFELAKLPETGTARLPTTTATRWSWRAERLFDGEAVRAARAAFEDLRKAARDDDRELVHLRIAECDYYLKRWRNARDRMRPYIDHASRQVGVVLYAASARQLGDRAEYPSGSTDC